MFVDCSKLPDPHSPLEDDVYTSLDGAHTLVVTNVPEHAIEDESRPPSAVIGFVLNGLTNACPQGHLPAIVASIGARPWGRLDRSAATRPEITRDPELVVQRLRAIGPHLRALREQYGLSTGDLARSMGCPTARLSMLELGEPDPARGVRENEGRAALAELLAGTIKRVYVIHRGEGSGAFEADVWQEIYGMLATEPARAAMSTILKIGAAKPSSGTPAPMPTRALTQALQLDKGGFRIEVYEPAPDNLSDYDLTREYGGLILGSGRWQPTTNEAFSRAAVAQRWPGVSVEWIEHPDVALRCLRTTDETALQIADAPARGLLVVNVPPATATSAWYSGFRPGDRITYKGKAATVREVDHEEFAMLVTFESGETSAVPLADVQLANEGVAVSTACAGHLTGAVMEGLEAHLEDGLTRNDETLAREHLPSVFVRALATDEVQRLIRLHG